MTTTNRMLASRPPETRSLRHFTIEQAQHLIPTLVPLLDELWSHRRTLAIELLAADPALAAMRPGTTSAATERRAIDLKTRIARSIATIEAHGCVVKDVDLGLLDFPSRREGRTVFLCWKPGEPTVGYWHGTSETFADRKPI